MSFWPYRWKSVLISFSNDELDETVLSEANQQRFKGARYGGKTVIKAGRYKPFGRKLADSLALKMIDDTSGIITIEPCEQVFFGEYISGRDKNHVLLTWLSNNFGVVTLSEDIDDSAAADDSEKPISVTKNERRCLICNADISDKREGAVTCSPSHRKALSRNKGK